MATKQQDGRTETSNQERAERPGAKVERPRRDLASWFSFGDWRVQKTAADEWALA